MCYKEFNVFWKFQAENLQNRLQSVTICQIGLNKKIIPIGVLLFSFFGKAEKQADQITRRSNFNFGRKDV